jgi:hypothetical protein
VSGIRSLQRLREDLEALRTERAVPDVSLTLGQRIACAGIAVAVLGYGLVVVLAWPTAFVLAAWFLAEALR